MLLFPSFSSGASLSVLKQRETRQKHTVWKDTHTFVFFRHHLKQAASREGRKAIRFARAELAWTIRELRETHQAQRVKKAAAMFPPHHALWLCIHHSEAGSWSNQNTGGNGHWGGLQMHPGWGYGTSYHASDDSQQVQEWAAERGYIASGHSKSWLNGQWGQTIGPCWQYA